MAVAFFKRISDFSSLVKISHTVFSMPFAIIGFFLAIQHTGNSFELKTFIMILLCVLFARNAAMSFNRIADRSFDKKNPRTRDRDIPSGKIKLKYAYFFLVANIILFFITTYLLNFLCFILSPIALIIVLGYSLTKRFTFLSHFFLGLSLSMAPIGAYLAVTAQFNIIPLLYSLFVFLWVSGFDIIYALNDVQFDREQGLHSLPARLGIKNALIISVILHLISLFVIIIAGMLNCNHLYFWIGTAIFAFFLFYQHYIVRHHDLSRLNRAFFTMNGLSGIVFLCFYVLDFYFPV